MDPNYDTSDLDNDVNEKINLLLTIKTSERRIEERSFHLLEVMIFYGNKSRQGTKFTY